MDSSDTIGVLRHIIEYVRERHDHTPDGTPYVDSLLLEAHIMELIGRLTAEPDYPVRFSVTGQVQLREMRRREVNEYRERIAALEEALGYEYDDEMGFSDAFSIVQDLCITEEAQEAFDLLMEDRNSYVCQYHRLSNENSALRKLVMHLTDKLVAYEHRSTADVAPLEVKADAR